MFLAAGLLAFLVAWLRGGTIRGFAGFAFRRVSWIAVAFAIRSGLSIAASRGISFDPIAAAALHLGSYLLLLGSILSNARVPGMWAMGLGCLGNFAAIALNGGKMPVSPGAIARLDTEDPAGAIAYLASGADPIHGLLDGRTRVPWLGDLFVLPDPLPGHTVFSVGDVAIVIGLFWLVQRAMRRELPGTAPGRGLPPLSRA